MYVDTSNKNIAVPYVLYDINFKLFYENNIIFTIRRRNNNVVDWNIKKKITLKLPVIYKQILVWLVQVLEILKKNVY